MLKSKLYSFGELVEALQLESSESKPVVGKNVWKDNATNNDKAVADIMKQTKEYDNVGTKDTTKSNGSDDITDYNKTTLDLDFDVEPSDAYKERVKAQAYGYDSVANQKNNEKLSDEEKNDSVEREGNKKFYDSMEKRSDKLNKNKAKDAHAGLKSQHFPEKDFKDKTIFKESRMKRLQYNKVFLNEEHVLNIIPDSYKVDKNRFMMQDINGSQYIIECAKDNHIDYIHTNIVGYHNPNALNEQMNRIKELTNYKSSNYNKIEKREKSVADNQMCEQITKLKKLMK